jgi:agmatinase
MQPDSNEKFCSQGHGIEGRYLGLTDEFAGLDVAKVVILPIPFDKTTTYTQGADRGPAALIEASRNMEMYDVESNSEPYLIGIHTAAPILAETSKEMIRLTQESAFSFLKKGKFIVGLGGEHAITPPLVAAQAQIHDNFSILQFDAHADLVPAYENNPFSHACAMARVKEIPQVSHIVSVGIRSVSSEEVPFLDYPHTFFAHLLHDGDQWMDQVIEKLSDKVYITFDLDAFDSALMPSTGTPEPGGLSWHQATKLLKKVAKNKQIIGFDVMELCPINNLKSPDYLAAKLVYKLLSYL